MQYLRCVPLNRTSESATLFLVNLHLTFSSHFLLSSRLFSMLLALLSLSLPLFSDYAGFLIKVLKLISSLTFLAFGNEAEKHLEATLSTPLQRAVVSDSCLPLLSLSVARVSFAFEPHTMKAASVCGTSCKVRICSCWLCLNWCITLELQGTHTVYFVSLSITWHYKRKCNL